MTEDSLTCVVPTHNRPHFLRRLFRLYAQFPPGFPFLVVDSSNPTAAAENRDVIESVRKTLHIDYQHFDLNIVDKCVQALERVRSPFVVFCADDDYLLPDSVWRCVEFLKDQPRYDSAMGRVAMLNTKQPRWCGMVHQGYSIEEDRPFDRCVRLADSWFSNFYAVQRTQVYCEIFQITAANTDSGLSLQVGEMLLAQLSVIRGRVKTLPFIYSLMEKHDANSGKRSPAGVLLQAEWLYQRFKGCLTEQLEQTGIARAEAEQFIDNTYGFFRDPKVARQRRRRSTSVQVRRFFRKMTDLTGDALRKDYRNRGALKRLIRASDIAGCRPIWQAAVQLIYDFPRGIPGDPSPLER